MKISPPGIRSYYFERETVRMDKMGVGPDEVRMTNSKTGQARVFGRRTAASLGSDWHPTTVKELEAAKKKEQLQKVSTGAPK